MEIYQYRILCATGTVKDATTWFSMDDATTGPSPTGWSLQDGSLPDNHVMVAKWSTFWPIEDFGKSGYCYGWVNSRVICVAGVLRVESLGKTLVYSRSF